MIAKLSQRNLEVIFSEEKRLFDDVTQLTADICDAPICLISLKDEPSLQPNLEIGAFERSIHCYDSNQNDYTEIEDTRLDDRIMDPFLDHHNKPIIFYASSILRTLEGSPVGTLSVLDYHPRVLNDLQRRTLEFHAENIMRRLELNQALNTLGGRNEHFADSAKSSQKESGRIQEIESRFSTLTPRESEIVQLFADHSGSLTNKEAARELEISPRTVEHHRAKIMSKMNVESVAELIALIIRSKITY